MTQYTNADIEAQFDEFTKQVYALFHALRIQKLRAGGGALIYRDISQRYSEVIPLARAFYERLAEKAVQHDEIPC